MGYEPFGKRRQASGQADPTGQIDGQRSRRGFTGHEHLDEVDYLHLNARLYDPDLGRFLSPDPTVPYLHHLQSFNRYSYTRNNPLNFIDPTGFTYGSPSAGSSSQPAGALANGFGEAGALNGAHSPASANAMSPADLSNPQKQASSPGLSPAPSLKLAMVGAVPMVPTGPVVTPQDEAQRRANERIAKGVSDFFSRWGENLQAAIEFIGRLSSVRVN